MADWREKLKDDRKAAVKMMIKMARAIHAAHQHGILHRNIKPGNILVDEAGKKEADARALADRRAEESRLE